MCFCGHPPPTRISFIATTIGIELKTCSNNSESFPMLKCLTSANRSQSAVRAPSAAMITAALPHWLDTNKRTSHFIREIAAHFPNGSNKSAPFDSFVQIQRSNCQLCKIFVAMRPLIPPFGQFHLNPTQYLNTFPNYQLSILIINQCRLKSTTWRHPAFDSIGNANRCRSFNKLETSLVDCKFHSTRPQVSIGQLMRRNAAIQSTKWSKRSCGCPQQSSCFTLVNSSSFVKSC